MDTSYTWPQEEILLPEGMEEIPARAFFRCHSLKKISLPSTLKRIGREAFLSLPTRSANFPSLISASPYSGTMAVSYRLHPRENAERVGRERIVISDKARFYDGNEMYQAVRTSRENLGTWADVYFVHQVDPDHEEEVFRKTESTSSKEGNSPPDSSAAAGYSPPISASTCSRVPSPTTSILSTRWTRIMRRRFSGKGALWTRLRS